MYRDSNLFEVYGVTKKAKCYFCTGKQQCKLNTAVDNMLSPLDGSVSCTWQYSSAVHLALHKFSVMWSLVGDSGGIT